jgi:hypothetical protein
MQQALAHALLVVVVVVVVVGHGSHCLQRKLSEPCL